jgi:hypothetical protein
MDPDAFVRALFSRHGTLALDQLAPDQIQIAMIVHHRNIIPCGRLILPPYTNTFIECYHGPPMNYMPVVLRRLPLGAQLRVLRGKDPIMKSQSIWSNFYFGNDEFQRLTLQFVKITSVHHDNVTHMRVGELCRVIEFCAYYYPTQMRNLSECVEFHWLAAPTYKLVRKNNLSINFQRIKRLMAQSHPLGLLLDGGNAASLGAIRACLPRELWMMVAQTAHSYQLWAGDPATRSISRRW